MSAERILSKHNVLAAFGDPDPARHAIEQLETAGVDAASISLSPESEAASDRADTMARDRQLMAKGERTAVGGILLGTIAGAVLGFIGGLVAFGIPGDSALGTWGVIAFTVGGGVAGGGVGLIGAGAGRMQQSQAWEQSLEPTGDGRFVVGVHSENGEEVARAQQVLADLEPLELRRVDSEGHPVDAE